MNKVKIAKYTKEKRAEAGRKYREEQKKMKYGTAVNMLYVLGDTWRTSRGLFAATLINVVMSMANALCLTFTDKLVIEFALDMSPGTGLTAAAVIAGGFSRLWRPHSCCTPCSAGGISGGIPSLSVRWQPA